MLEEHTTASRPAIDLGGRPIHDMVAGAGWECQLVCKTLREASVSRQPLPTKRMPPTLALLLWLVLLLALLRFDPAKDPGTSLALCGCH